MSNSIQIDEDVSFKYDEYSKILSITDSISNSDSINVCYRTISPFLVGPFALRDISKYDHGGNNEFSNQSSLSSPKKTELLSTPGLYKAGTITRGITVGNRQSLFVNSSLNLQMSGKLSEELYINTVITDRNIPYQPEGNTQQISDFDNVFIELYNQKISLKAGDIVLKNPENYGHFLKYYKNQQGIQFGVNQSIGDKWQSKSLASIAIAKGKFASIYVQSIEGVQGPYKLRGAQNERFVIVLANSEKVYMDGELLKRGYNQDYVIDYNLGEIIFNPNIVITRFTRIRVDFEYLQQQYLRNNMLVSQQMMHKNGMFYVDYYQERDNINRPSGLKINDDNILLLKSYGDNNDLKIAGIDSVGFVENRVLYSKTDTLINNEIFTIYRYSNDPETALYSLSFNEVGLGNGNYLQISSNINGRVFEWQAPINGQLQGNYEPEIEVVTPLSKQMIVVGGKININEHLSLNQEVAFSNQDKNLYSNVDDEDNNSYASISSLEISDIPISILSNYLFNASLGYEFDFKNFMAIDRFRTIDFDRSWNFISPNDSTPDNDRIIGFSASINKNPKNYISYNLTNRMRGNVLNGNQHHLGIHQKVKSIFYRGDHSYSAYDQNLMNIFWNESFSEIGSSFRFIEFGYSFRLDQNKILDNTENVVGSAMHYVENGAFLRNSDSSDFILNAFFTHRNDKLPLDGMLVDYTEANQVSLELGAPSKLNQQLKTWFTYRQVTDLLSIDNRKDNVIQGRVLSVNTLFNKHVKSNFSYASQNGRELKRSYIYTMVGSGQGTHTWRDDNSNNIQDLSEFYEAINTDERNYIKLFVPTDEYLNAYQTTYNHSIDAELPRKWRGSVWVLNELSKLSVNTNFNVNRKVTSGNLNQRMNPFQKLEQENLIYDRSNFRYSLFYNRSRSGFGFNITYNERLNTLLNESGFESNAVKDIASILRFNFQKIYQISFESKNGITNSVSDFLKNRNFRLQNNIFSTIITWQPGNTFRVNSGYSVRLKRNILNEYSSEKVNINDFSAGVTWTQTQTGSLDFVVNYAVIDFVGEANSYIGYTMMEALQPGNNLKLNLNWQQNLKNGLQLTFQYFGRKSESVKLIHSGSMQLTAFF